MATYAEAMQIKYDYCSEVGLFQKDTNWLKVK